MKNAAFLSAVLATVISLIATAKAVVPGETVEYEGGGRGKVVFDGTRHYNAMKRPGKRTPCRECHPEIFLLKRFAVKINMKDIYAGRYCGACHNGKKAFDAEGKNNCNKCHKR